MCKQIYVAITFEIYSCKYTNISTTVWSISALITPGRPYALSPASPCFFSFSSPARPYLPGLIKLPVGSRGCCWRLGMGDSPCAKREREEPEIMNRRTALLGSIASEWERCYNGCGQTFYVSSRRSIQLLISCISTLSRVITPSLLSPYNLVLSLAVNLSRSFSHVLSFSLWQHLFFLFAYSLFSATPFLFFTSLAQIDLHIFSGNWHFPFACLFFPIGCKPVSPRQRW